MIQPDTSLTTRNATVADLAHLLRAQHAAKLDVVAPARSLIAERGILRLVGVSQPSGRGGGNRAVPTRQ